MELIPVTTDNLDIYLEVGVRSYRQHYLHLWKDSDPLPYIDSNLTVEVVHRELNDPNEQPFIIMHQGVAAGIIKIVKDVAIADYSSAEAMLLEKIYLLRAYSGMGLGKECLRFVVDFARSLKKKVLWLDTMKQGRALSFYLEYGFEIIGEKDLALPDVLEDQKAMYILAYSL